MKKKSVNNLSKGKVTAGYILLLLALFVSLTFVYREMGHLMSSENADLLRTDSLLSLLQQKDSNTLDMLRSLSEAHEGLLSADDLEEILNKEDNAVLQHRVKHRVISHRDTILTKQKKKGFFKRLGEVFAPSKKDTAIQVKTSTEFATDTLLDAYNPADSLHKKIKRVTHKKKAVHLALERRKKVFEQFNDTLTARIDSLLESYEQNSLSRARSEAELQRSVRQRSTTIIGGFAIGGLLLAAVFLLMIWRDITRSNRYRRQLEIANRKAEQLLIAREKLMLTITHDFKAPLGSIKGYVDLLSRLTIDERQRFYLNNMKVSSEHLLKLVSDLLEFHRLDLRKVEIDCVPFQPAQMFEEIKISFEPLATAKRLYLRSNIATDLKSSYVGDPLRLRQIITNLLSNAIKFTDRGGITMSACYMPKGESSLTNSHLKISIADTGKGMLPDDRERIFQEFTRLPDAQGKEGFGLGLSIVRMLIHLMKGTIEVESELGKGSVFIVRIPVSPVSVEDTRKKALDNKGDKDEKPFSDEALTTSSKLKPVKVLLIDDDRIQLDLTSAMLASQGIQSVCCLRVDEVLDALRGDSFDALLTDVQMPEINGFDLLRLLRASNIPQARTIPVIAVSARTDIELAHFQESGFSACLQKPFTVNELVQLIPEMENKQIISIKRKMQLSNTESSSVIDFSSLTAFIGDGQEEINSILKSFISETLLNAERLREGLKADDMNKVADMGHKMIPLFTLLKMTDLVSKLRFLETNRNAIMTEEMRQKGYDSLRAIESVIVQCREYIKE